MPRKTNRIKTNAVPTPKSRQEAEALLLRIGNLQQDVKRIEADMNEELAEVKAAYEEQAAPRKEEIYAKFQALHTWCEANRESLLKGKGKTAKLTTGEVSWRTTPPRVTLRGQAAVIDVLKANGFGDLIRSKEEINKEAILLDPSRVEHLKGITVTQREEFVAKPFESQIEAVETVTASRKEAA